MATPGNINSAVIRNSYSKEMVGQDQGQGARHRRGGKLDVDGATQAEFDVEQDCSPEGVKHNVLRKKATASARRAMLIYAPLRSQAPREFCRNPQSVSG